MTQVAAEPDVSIPYMQAAALAWHDAGFCAVRARTDGTKRPVGEWTGYQTNRPDREQVARWFSCNHQGVGVICGQVSGGLEMFELEGRAVAEGAREKLVPALRDSGVYDVWTRLVKGYVEQSPTGGLHFLFRIADHPVPGNVKIASRPARDDELTDDERDLLSRHPNKVIVRTLAETRGEGGFVVVAPSHGPTHETGEPWTACSGSQYGVVPAVTWEERNALYGVVRAVLDEVPVPEPEPVRPSTEASPGSAGTGDRPGDHWARETSWADILEPHGWVVVYRRGGMDFWRRPGKRIGISARTGGAFDGLYVWSSSTEFPTEQSITKFRAYAILEHRGDDKAAGAELRRQGFGADRPRTTSSGTSTQVGDTTTEGESDAADVAAMLGEEFWCARPYLKHIRDAAHSRQRSAVAVLGTVLARVAAVIDHRLRIPDIVGDDAGLSLITVILAAPGIGKSSSSGIGSRLLLAPDTLDIADQLPLGTGEGMAEVFFGIVEEEGEKGKKQKIKEQVRHNAFFYVDEGQVIGEIGNRKNATLLPTIRSAFTGGTLGQMNASVDARRILPAGSYTMGIVVAMQMKLAGALLDDADGGTPQRMLWFPAIDPTVPEDGPSWPGSLDWQPPTPEQIRRQRGDGWLIGGTKRVYLDVADPIKREIKAADLGRVRGEVVIDTLDAHEGLLRLKVAALLAIADNRLSVSEEDWQLATLIKAASDACRNSVIETVKAEAKKREDAMASKLARRHVLAENTAAEDRIHKCATRIREKVWRQAPSDGWTRGSLYGDLRRWRDVFDDGLERAVEEGWVTEVVESSHTGDARRAIHPGPKAPGR